jgi:hypothetical protein
MRRRAKTYTASQVQQAIYWMNKRWEVPGIPQETWTTIAEMLSELHKIKLAQEKLVLE